MEEEELKKIVKKVKEISDSHFSDYAGFHSEVQGKDQFHHCFIVNDQKNHSSNFSVKLDNVEDAHKIVNALTGKNEKEVMKDLENNGSYFNSGILYLHYLKLLKECDQP
ncbi:hypothetical protein LZ575_07205 [Antarcticibacterium sp. 1MA-6-2]|uniref:hypothetical protein n=1 Tax=Antarcticibacterium sp. 1MA-6-2 TaxID=2908210 RepID=UPI001F2BA445|nr:hypothetical protein [Antarcticibacterium sp. 1MA-6-2]UJH92311.1 hypothetical protein LZ575_07205 [Antarcticibacterium sp. 1MA-6-2]